MIRKLHTRISPSSLLALVALFVALGGVSYAAATIGSAEIKDNSVRSKDVRNKTLVGKDVKKDALGGDQVNESKLGQVPSAVNADNATQAQSAQSAQTAASADTAATVGPDGVGAEALQANSVHASELGGTVVHGSTVNVAAGGTEFLTRSCAAGEQMIGGGPQWLGPNIDDDADQLRVVHSYPVSGASWGARVHNATGSAREVEFRVLCLAAN
jgi:hypothetical protein